MRIVKLTKETTKNILENMLKRSPSQYGEYESRVQAIIQNIKENGDEALFSYTKQFDKADNQCFQCKSNRRRIRRSI